MPRYLHTCYRIGDIDSSVSFYEKLGFQEARRMPIGDEATNVFMQLPGQDPVLELTYNHGVDAYDLGTAYGHIAVAVPDAYAACEKIRASGGAVTREAGPVMGGSTVIAFVTDPDGYKVELIQRS